MRGFLITACLLFIFIQTGNSQYFGRNKPSYKVFDYKVYQTPHFDIYHYWKHDTLLFNLAQASETWYKRHQFMLHDTIKFKNPLIIYENHADFQQTDAIMGEISIGTGGVTEAMKNRVVIPVQETWAQTNHVLGHELVHAFQYNIVINGDSSSLNNLRNLPLWMVEGMAEYMSIGSIDSHTAMWLRDAVMNKDFPTLETLSSDYRYFPYRYGQAFWAFTTRLYGDTIVRPLFKLTSLTGYEYAIEKLLGYDEKSFSNLWKSTTIDYYRKWIKETDTVDRVVGQKLLSEENSGRMNLAPTISPNGKYIAFLSEKDVFSIDLFLADAKTGKILANLANTERNPQIDDFSFVESAGTWSPDNRYLAFVIVSRGKNKLLVIDVTKPKKQKEYEIPGVPTLSNPAWSPKENKVVVSGQVGGVTSLYLFDIKEGTFEKLTTDPYAHLQPSWSADGEKIVFATDKPFNETDSTLHIGYNLGIYSLTNKKSEYYNLFPQAENLNPAFAPDGKSVFFLSNSDGFRNLYRFYPDSNSVFRLTKILTGISGITPYSPAMSIARDTNMLVYSHFFKGIYTVYRAGFEAFTPVKVDPNVVDMSPAMLPPGTKVGSNIIDKSLQSKDLSPMPVDSMKQVPYKAKFKLDYIGNTGVGMATSRYGTGIAGSVDFLFSDIVGNNTLYSSLSLNGEIYDFGGMLAYINSKNRIDWGVSISHVPYRFGRMSLGSDTAVYHTLTSTVVVDYYRLFQEQASLFASYPFSSTQRFELSTSLSHYSYRLDRYTYFYEYGTYNSLGMKRERDMPTPPGFSIQQVEAAYIIDNSFFGIASPLRGYRARFSVEKYIGDVDMFTLQLDYRKYFYMRPFCLAIRAMHYGRYGKGSENTVMSPLFLGYPWYVRGYDNSYFYSNSSGVSIDQLQGSRMIVSNVELRVPFTGPEKVSLINSKMFYTELAVFFDGGLAWTSSANPTWSLNYSTSKDDLTKRLPVFSTGVSLRINLFGAMILEPFYAFPLGQGKDSHAFGLNFFPGW